MPHIEIKVMEGVFDADEKARIIRAVIKAFGDAAGGKMFENTSAKIEEIKSGSWGFADQIMTTEFGLSIKNDKS
ncbi:tautomerase family protein [Defluviimonas aestuarii]|uniref:tautomerase family protein n=1 Tax=Albidovulum aestuarii TaxID=1130726 RepID=UPI00249C8A08|nr:tautomerase family protein [Defluviimonas aestuarii]MDI3335005.1 tautomerase family protein [Defluviimonas aestuarii]